jgi:hypothetical protein
MFPTTKRRELARAGLIEPIHTFALARESRYRFTTEGCTVANPLQPRSISRRISRAPRLIGIFGSALLSVPPDV